MSEDPSRPAGTSVRKSSPKPGLAAWARRAAKVYVRRTRQWFVRRFHAFTPGDLRRCLTEVGVARGDCVLVHASYDAFEGFTGKPSDVIAALMDAVGPEGTLLMPTLPFTGTAVAWAQEHPVLDLVRTPSRMGLVSEMFRRSPGVLRSVHPTHPVAAWGRHAEQVVAGHHLVRTPCGKGSPFDRLLERHGKMLLLGVDIDSLTFYHLAEELLESQLPVSPFTRETFHLSTRDADGRLVPTETRLFDPAVSRRRNLAKLGNHLAQRGAWRRMRVGRLIVTQITARATYDAIRDLAGRGIYCYD